MRKLATILSNYDAATTGFSEGKIRDNPGDDTGSGVVADWGNDLYYALEATIKRYKTGGVLSDAAESETASDFLQAIEELAGVYVGGVSAWSAATAYTVKGTTVMRYGIQFVNLSTSNTNHDPLTEPTYWMAIPDKRELLAAHTSGRVIVGDSSPLHDFNNAAYSQYLSLGLHNFGGVSGANYNAYLVHLDGQAIGSGALSTIVEAWHLKGVWMPGSTGSRTAADARGKVPRGIDATGGQADAMGEVLADQTQGHFHTGRLASSISGGSYGFPVSVAASSGTVRYGAGQTYTTNMVEAPESDGTNGTPRVGLKTRDQSYTVGVPYVVILVAA